MPILGNITYNSNPNTFLQANEINNIVKSMEEEGLSDINGNIYQPIQDEMEKGLSLEALNIDGQAPLNDIAQELLRRINTSIRNMENVKKMAEGEGNKHRQGEANEYYEKVIEEYRKKYNTLSQAVSDYNANNTCTLSTDVSPTEKKTYTSSYPNCSCEPFSSTMPPIVVGLKEAYPNDINKGVHNAYKEAVETALINAKDFYDSKVITAKKLKEECDGLNTLTTDLPKTSSGKLYNGVIEGATVYTSYDTKGNKTEEYFNEDGTSVKISYNEKGYRKQKEYYNKNGMLTKTIEYDGKGNSNDHMTEKKEFSSNIYTHNTEKGDAYLTTEKVYTREKGKWIEDENKEKTIYNEYDATSGKYNQKTAITYDYIKQSATNEEDIYIPQGYKLVYDNPNKIFHENIPGGTTLKYDKESKMYEGYDINGNKLSLEKKVLINGLNEDNNISSLVHDNNTRLIYDKAYIANKENSKIIEETIEKRTGGN